MTQRNCLTPVFRPFSIFPLWSIFDEKVLYGSINLAGLTLYLAACSIVNASELNVDAIAAGSNNLGQKPTQTDRLRPFQNQKFIASNDTGEINSEKWSAMQALDEVFTAYGGLQKLKQFDKSTLDLYGTLNNSKWKQNESCSVHLVETEVGCISELRKNDGLWVTGYDGVNAWNSHGRKILQASTSKLWVEKFKKDYSVFRVLANIGPNSTVNVLPNENVNGMLCKGISVYLEKSYWMCIWYHPHTHLVTRMSYCVSVDGTHFESPYLMREFSDYKTISGFVFPYRIDEFIRGNHEITKWDRAVLLEPSTLKIKMPEDPDRLAQPITIPFTLDGMQLLFDCSINGNKGRFRLDTGLSKTCVSQRLADMNDISLSGNNTLVPMYSLFSESKYREASIKKFAIGDKILRDDISVLVGGAATDDYELTVGIDFLRRYCIRLDFTKNTATFSNESTTDSVAEKSIILPFKLTDAPYVNGKINGQISRAFAVDTGSTSFVLINANELSESFLQDHAKAHKMLDINAQSGYSSKQVIHSIQLSDLTLENIESDLIKPNEKFVHGYDILGLPFLKRFPTVTFDFPKERLILELPEGKDSPATIDCSNLDNYKIFLKPVPAESGEIRK